MPMFCISTKAKILVVNQIKNIIEYLASIAIYEKMLDNVSQKWYIISD